MDAMKSPPDMPVLLTSADSAFSMPCAVMLRSVADNLSWTPAVHAVVMDVGLTARDRRRIRSSVRWTPLSVEFLELSTEALAGLKVDGHVSKAAYARLVALDMLKDRFAKCIYIDADFVVLRDIGELWEIDLKGFALAAVRDFLADCAGSTHGLIDPGYWGIQAQCPYFNSGLLIIDVLRWRAEQMSSRAIELIRKHPNKIRWWDQDALNILIQGQFLQIGLAWNIHPQAFTWPRVSDLALLPEDIHRCMEAPRAIHFAGPMKPWRNNEEIWGTNHFMRYLYRTAWRDRVPNAPWRKSKIGLGLWVRRLAQRIQVWRKVRGVE